jgi:hypothetical protein
MLKVIQGLTLPQSQKYSGLVSRLLQGHQVLNLTEGHHPLDPLLWASILEDRKLSGVFGVWVIWIHEELQLDPLRLVRVRPINLVHLLNLGNKRNWGAFLLIEGSKETEDLENLLMKIVWIDLLEISFTFKQISDKDIH